jgi:hypothetical protein
MTSTFKKKEDLSAALRRSEVKLLSDVDILCDSDVVRLSGVLKALLRKGKQLHVAVLHRNS